MSSDVLSFTDLFFNANAGGTYHHPLPIIFGTALQFAQSFLPYSPTTGLAVACPPLVSITRTSPILVSATIAGPFDAACFSSVYISCLGVLIFGIFVGAGSTYIRSKTGTIFTPRTPLGKRERDPARQPPLPPTPEELEDESGDGDKDSGDDDNDEDDDDYDSDDDDGGDDPDDPSDDTDVDDDLPLPDPPVEIPAWKATGILFFYASVISRLWRSRIGKLFRDTVYDLVHHDPFHYLDRSHEWFDQTVLWLGDQFLWVEEGSFGTSSVAQGSIVVPSPNSLYAMADFDELSYHHIEPRPITHPSPRNFQFSITITQFINTAIDSSVTRFFVGWSLLTVLIRGALLSSARRIGTALAPTQAQVEDEDSDDISDLSDEDEGDLIESVTLEVLHEFEDEEEDDTIHYVDGIDGIAVAISPTPASDPTIIEPLASPSDSFIAEDTAMKDTTVSTTPSPSGKVDYNAAFSSNNLVSSTPVPAHHINFTFTTHTTPTTPTTHTTHTTPTTHFRSSKRIKLDTSSNEAPSFSNVTTSTPLAAAGPADPFSEGLSFSGVIHSTPVAHPGTAAKVGDIVGDSYFDKTVTFLDEDIPIKDNNEVRYDTPEPLTNTSINDSYDSTFLDPSIIKRGVATMIQQLREEMAAEAEAKNTALEEAKNVRRLARREAKRRAEGGHVLYRGPLQQLKENDSADSEYQLQTWHKDCSPKVSRSSHTPEEEIANMRMRLKKAGKGENLTDADLRWMLRL